MGRSAPSIRIPTWGWITTLLIAGGCLAFLLLRYTAQGQAALIASQLIYLAAPAAASVLSALAASAAPQGSRARLIWGLLGVSTLFVTLSEAIYSYNIVSGVVAAGAAGSLADVLNMLGVLAFAGVLGTVMQLDLIGAKGLLQMLLDVLIAFVLSFTLVYRFGVSQLMSHAAPAEVADAVRHAIYSSVGTAMVIGVIFCAFGVRGRARLWDVLLFIGLLIFALGVALWPLWSLAADQHLGFVFAEPFINSLYFLGYAVTALAAFVRLRAANESWQIAVSFQRPRLVWPGMVSATVVFAAVGVLAWAFLKPASQAADEIVYYLGVSFAAVAMVGRTALATIELDEVRQTSVTDSLTGAFNTRRLTEIVDGLFDAAHRSGYSFALALVDVDDLDAINQREGRAVGDAVLTDMAGVLASVAEGPENVFRLSGDEFAVLMPGVDDEEAGKRTRRLLAAVEAARPGSRDITASIGYALCTADICNPQELLMRAESAQQWAKHHGKNRIVCFDEDVVSRSGHAAPLEALQEGPPLDIARALSAAADARDPANYRHSRNVAALSTLLARSYGLEEDHIRRIEVAALLHDVGKIALPDAMLGGKTLPFRQRQRAEEHAALGARLVESLGVAGLSSWVRSHHERWDGRGYPDQLSGEQIPLEARIVAIADAYDGMTTGKRYGAPMSKGAALQELDLGIGARFDPTLAELFIAVVGATEALGWSDDWPAA